MRHVRKIRQGVDLVPEDISKQLKAELDQLRGNAEYGTFRPVLEQIERLVNAQTDNLPALDTTRAMAGQLIEIVKAGHAAEKKGQDPREFLDETIRGQGFHQDRWSVKGDVTQAGRDIVNQPITVILTEAARELKPPDSVAIPTVLVAMTATEAKALAAESSFKGQPRVLLEEFRKLSSHLQRIGVVDWVSFYGPKSEDWRSNGGEKSIADLVRDALEILNNAKHLPK